MFTIFTVMMATAAITNNSGSGSRPSSNCATIRGDPCVFPFALKDPATGNMTTMTKCTGISKYGRSSSDGLAWCATSAEKNEWGHYPTGYCSTEACDGDDTVTGFVEDVVHDNTHCPGGWIRGDPYNHVASHYAVDGSSMTIAECARVAAHYVNDLGLPVSAWAHWDGVMAVHDTERSDYCKLFFGAFDPADVEDNSSTDLFCMTPPPPLADAAVHAGKSAKSSSPAAAVEANEEPNLGALINADLAGALAAICPNGWNVIENVYDGASFGSNGRPDRMPDWATPSDCAAINTNNDQGWMVMLSALLAPSEWASRKDWCYIVEGDGSDVEDQSAAIVDGGKLGRAGFYCLGPPVTTAPSTHPTCTTKDKDSDPLHRCVFPFRYNNQLFTSCIVDGLDPDEGDTWCATTADYDTDGEWGICETTVEAACPTVSTPTKPAITTPSITTSTLTSPSPPPPIFTATPLPSTATPPPTTSSSTITTSTTPTPLLVTTETTIKTSETPTPPTKTTPPTSTSTAVPTNSRKTCSELGWSQIVGNVCGESDANLGGCHRGLDYNSAAAVCAAAGARLCSRNEIIAQTTKGTGCSFDKTNIWSSTECDGGYETMRGKNGRRRTCSSTTETGNVRCCSDVTIAAVAALASSTSVQLQGNPFTTGSSVVFAAKGVDGQTGSNAATAAAATIAIVFLLVGIAALRRPTTTATPPFDQQDNNNNNNTSAVVEGETEDNNNIAAVAAPDADHENVFAECEFVVHNDVGTLQIKSVRRPNPAYRASTIIDMLDSGVGQANAATHI